MADAAAPALIAEAAAPDARRAARADVRGAGGASTGFFASGRTAFGFAGVGFCSGTIFAGSGLVGVGGSFCSGGAATSGFSCGGVGAICSSTVHASRAPAAKHRPPASSGPGAMSASIDCGAEVTGARSTMIAGSSRRAPGAGRCQLMAERDHRRMRRQDRCSGSAPAPTRLDRRARTGHRRSLAWA